MGWHITKLPVVLLHTTVRSQAEQQVRRWLGRTEVALLTSLPYSTMTSFTVRLEKCLT